jgi:hypothetical protein
VLVLVLLVALEEAVDLAHHLLAGQAFLVKVIRGVLLFLLVLIAAAAAAALVLLV